MAVRESGREAPPGIANNVEMLGMAEATQGPLVSWTEAEPMTCSIS